MPQNNSNNLQSSQIYTLNDNYQNNSSIYLNNNQQNIITYNKKFEKIPIIKPGKSKFLTFLYYETNINKMNNFLYTDRKKKQDSFNDCLDHAILLLSLNYNSFLLDKIYVKKISEHYRYDYYKFIDYELKQDYNVINNYKKELNQIEKLMLEEMKKEIISENPYIKLFIFNKYCFLKKNTVSVYIPHILKREKNCPILTSLLNDKKINISDFVADYEYNDKCLFIIILEKRLKSIENSDSQEFGFGEMNNGERGFIYTTVPADLLEESILNLELSNFNKKYYGGYFSEKSEKSSAIINAYINDHKNTNNINFFEKNEDYLRGMSTQQLILFFILNELSDEYINLPRLIIFENLIDVKGNHIYKTKNLQYIEYDSIILSKKQQIYDKKFPLILQKSYLFDGQDVKEEINPESNNNYFQIDKFSVYFFEVKTSLDESDQSKLGNLISNLIKNFEIFYETFKNKNIIKDKEIETIPNIILIYDFRKIETELLQFLREKKHKYKYPFKLEIIYCLPNYSYFSFSKLKKKQEQTELKLKETEEKLNKKLDEQSKEISKLKLIIDEMKKKL